MAARKRPLWRTIAGGLALLLALLLAAILLVAILPGFDLARLLLAANGSIIRGMVAAGAAAAILALLAAWLWRGGRRRWAAIALAGASILLAGFNVAAWANGVAREAIAFQSDGVRLEGTLMLPVGVERPPVAVIVHGSAPFARDFYAVWGRPLVARGVAVFVYDKRGTGRSEGVVPDDNGEPDYLVQLGRDAARAMAELSRRRDVDPRRISLVGISQGGWTVPIAAALRPDVYRMAFLSGPAATRGEESAYSDASGEMNGRRAADLAAIRTADAAAAKAGPDGFDPIPYLRAARAPGRWYFGDRDRSVPVSISRANLARLRSAGKDFQIVLFSDADHVLLDRSSLPYGFVPELMPSLAKWLSEGE